MGLYIVHSYDETTKRVDAKMDDGTVVHAYLPVAVIELLPADAHNPNTLTLTEVVADADARARCRALFKRDARICATFTPATGE